MSVENASPLQKFFWRVTNDVTILRLAGSALFFLGMAGGVVATFSPNSPDKGLLLAQSVFLLALGIPVIYHVQSLARFAALESRIKVLKGTTEEAT
jgi:hypothetical protein